MATSIEITGLDQLASAIELHDQKVKRLIAGQFLFVQPEAVAYAKQNAPWTDRTTNARNGLHANVSSADNGNIFELILAHSVFYGVFLETRFSGKYAIIMPTINYIGRILMDRIAATLDQAGAAA